MFPKTIFPQTCFVFPIFIMGERFFLKKKTYAIHRASCCSSLRELPLFSIELMFCIPLILCFLLSSIVYVYYLLFVWVFFVNTWQKGGEEIDEIWESCLKRFLTVFMKGEMKLFLKGEKKKIFDAGGELVSMFVICCYCIYIYIYIICLYFHTCIDVLFWVFHERQVHSDQDLLPLIATFKLGVLDWDLWCNWVYYCNKVALVFEHFILYVSFVTDYEKGRFLGSKS